MAKILNTAEPTMVPMPISAWLPGLTKAIMATNNSGALEPMAIKVAPAISWDIFNCLAMRSSDSIKYLSLTWARR